VTLESPYPPGTTVTSPVDAVANGYVTWREESAAAAAAYDTWTRTTPPDNAKAFAEYLAALDREEHAAAEYQRLLS
jgi:hypothetical protein